MVRHQLRSQESVYVPPWVGEHHHGHPQSSSASKALPQSLLPQLCQESALTSIQAGGGQERL